MINTLPLRLTILHLAQRFRIDGETFIRTILLTTFPFTTSQVFDYTRSSFFRLDTQISQSGSGDSQD